jgi:hypothetical protein
MSLQSFERSRGLGRILSLTNGFDFQRNLHELLEQTHDEKTNLYLLILGVLGVKLPP